MLAASSDPLCEVYDLAMLDLDGVVYVGSGYQFLRVGTPNNKLYAFSVDGK